MSDVTRADLRQDAKDVRERPQAQANIKCPLLGRVLDDIDWQGNHAVADEEWHTPMPEFMANNTNELEIPFNKVLSSALTCWFRKSNALQDRWDALQRKLMTEYVRRASLWLPLSAMRDFLLRSCFSEFKSSLPADASDVAANSPLETFFDDNSSEPRWARRKSTEQPDAATVCAPSQCKPMFIL